MRAKARLPRLPSGRLAMTNFFSSGSGIATASFQEASQWDIFVPPKGRLPRAPCGSPRNDSRPGCHCWKGSELFCHCEPDSVSCQAWQSHFCFFGRKNDMSAFGGLEMTISLIVIARRKATLQVLLRLPRLPFRKPRNDSFFLQKRDCHGLPQGTIAMTKLRNCQINKKLT